MKRVSVVLGLSLFAAAPAMFAAAPAMAQSACSSVTADGKPLSGAFSIRRAAVITCFAKTTPRAPVARLPAPRGAAKTSSVKKCMAG